MWDYTCRDTVAPSNIDLSSQEAGKAATKAEADKLSKYTDLTRNYTVIPVAMETLGSWGQIGLKFVKDIGQRIQDNTGERRATSYLLQSVGIATQRGNAISIRGTIPDVKSLDELFYL